MSLPIQKCIVAATPPLFDADNGPTSARGGLDLLSAASSLHPPRADTAPSGKSPEDAGAFAPDAREAPPAPDAGEAARAQAGSPFGRNKKFPEILMEILSNEDYAPVIGWLPCGERFLIRDPERLTSDILPKHFRRGTNFLSFRRKLNRYGFNAVRQCAANVGPVFEHKHFLRGHPELLGKLYCQKKQASGKVPIAKKSVSGNGAAEDVAQGCGAAGPTAAASRVAIHQAITASYDAASAAAAATHAPGGVLAQHIISAQSSTAKRYAAAPSYYGISAAPTAVHIPREVPVSLMNSAHSGVANVHVAAPSYNTLISGVTAARVPGAVPALFMNRANGSIANVHTAVPSYSSLIDEAGVAQVPRGVLASNNLAVAQRYDAAGAAAAPGQIPRGASLPLVDSDSYDSAFRDLLESDLLLRELKQRRQRALVRLLRGDPLPAEDNNF